jgi:hypothetical protein
MLGFFLSLSFLLLLANLFQEKGDEEVGRIQTSFKPS